jgi:RNA polymerase sigma-70 factor (ECF subfamily)
VGKRYVLNAKQLEAERRIIEASRRQPSRFGQLYERYVDRVYAFALTRTGDRSAAEDVTAETFRRAIQNLPSFQWRGVPFSAWLFRIAANQANDYYQRASRETPLTKAVENEDQSWETRLIEVETRTHLFELVEQLPKDQRQVIALRFGQEMSIQETCLTMRRSESAVKSLQHRAMETLRKWVGESDE